MINRSVLLEVTFEEPPEFVELGYAKTDVSGIGYLNYTPWEKPGGYLIAGTFLGDSCYEGSFSYGVLTINKELCRFEVEDVTVLEDLPITFQAKLTEDDGPPLEGKNVEFYIQLKHIETIQLPTVIGPIPYPIPTLVLDSISQLYYQYFYSKYSYLGEIENITFRDPQYYIFGLSYYIYGGKVIVTYWKYTGESITDSTGEALYEWDEQLDIGKYNAKAVFRGDDYYYPCNGTDHVTIIPLEVDITINGYWIDSDYKLEILVLDENGDPVEGVEIEFFIFNNESRTFTVVTNGTGQAIVLLHDPIMGKYTVMYTIAGSSFITEEPLFIAGWGRPAFGLGSLIKYWILISSTNDWVSAMIAFAASSAFLLAVSTAATVAWLAKGDLFQGLFWSALVTGIITGITFAHYFIYLQTYTWDYALQYVMLYVGITGGNIIGVYASYACWLVLTPEYGIENLLLGKPDNSVGLVILGPDTRLLIAHYFNNHPEMAKKLKFVYLGYYGGLLDIWAYQTITTNAIIMGFVNDEPFYYKIVQFTVRFFKGLSLFKLKPSFSELNFLAFEIFGLYFPITATILLIAEITWTVNGLYSAGCPAVAVVWSIIAVVLFLGTFVTPPLPLIVLS